MLSDTHCHLNHPQFDPDLGDVLARAEGGGVGRMLCIGWDVTSSLRAVRRARECESVFACVGIHPEHADEWNAESKTALQQLIADPENKVRAWGEIGLDYYRDGVPRAVQMDVFAAQIDAAHHVSPTLPLIIHCREALGDILDVLHNAQTPAPVVLHCWTGNAEDARRPLDMGCYFGVGGVATFKKSDSVRDALRVIPVDRILLETDCPYLAPQAVRGKRNEPSFIPFVAQTLADVAGLTVAQVARQTSATAARLFGW